MQGSQLQWKSELAASYLPHADFQVPTKVAVRFTSSSKRGAQCKTSMFPSQWLGKIKHVQIALHLLHLKMSVQIKGDAMLFAGLSLGPWVIEMIWLDV